MKSLSVLLLASLALLSACESEKVDLQKSPCVGIEGNPCGPKRMPVDNWVSSAHDVELA